MMLRGLAERQQLTQPFIALARDPSQPLFAGGRVLLPRLAQLGGERAPPDLLATAATSGD
jgi:hypothetical protein